MRNRVFHGLIVFVAFSAASSSVADPNPAMARFGQANTSRVEAHKAVDPRLCALQRFFKESQCPLASMSMFFLTEADTNGLDWRLLPSLSFIESGGGKAFRENNVFGWDSGTATFPSIRAGIHVVAYRLSHARSYKGKDLDELLTTYNPVDGYPSKVKWVMRRISSFM